ncbi:EscU/YscU/HrcU family type III secretion system export apparatus switch protein [Peptococcaceae bacterium]|nr:EscU/YscU/HrcU family type III secretion system export apparatus switch protein [Peptococcaceae bacterium]
MKNTRRIAVALKYDAKEHSAPKVAASGRGEIANKIIKIAEEHNVPVYHDKILAESLSMLGIGVEIPPELYRAVAKVLISISKLDKELTKH